MIPDVKNNLNQVISQETQPGTTFRLDREKDRFYGIADEREALKQAIYLTLNIERYKYPIYSWDYGVELGDLIGMDTDYCLAEIERRIQEALLQDDRITAVCNFDFQIKKNKVLTTFTVVSIFGDMEETLEVNI